jgi:Cu+-exporting ATPase
MKNIKCNHCNLEFTEDIMIKDNDKYFCCTGCQGVYHLLNDEGLDSFYDKVGSKTLSAPKEILDENLTKFDNDNFHKNYVTKLNDGNSKIHLIIEGIHCSACVWLNEKILHREEGILEANINYTNHKATIIWDNNQIKLSQIIERIRSIGYNAYVYDSTAQEQKASKEKRDYYIKMIVAIFASMNIMMLAIAKYSGYFMGIQDDIKSIIHYTEFFLATPVLFFSGLVFFRGAYYGLKNRFINMDFLVITGAVLTYVYSLYVLISGEGESYFDSVVMIITFVFIGKFLEVTAKKNIVDTLDTIHTIVDDTLTIVQDNTPKEISIQEVQIGDIIQTKAGDKIAIDGTIINGSGSFDYSSITGESEPIYRQKDDELISGSINIDGVIKYKANKTYETSTINVISNLIEESLNKKPNIEKMANNLSGSFSLIILGLSISTFLGWYFYNNMFENALINAIAVIVIACPCALALATPVATLVGITTASKESIIFKESKFLETLAKADIVLFDKTGTLTQAKPTVIKEEYLKEFDEDILFSLVSNSKHPISKAIANFIDSKQILELHDIKSITARGIKAKYKNQNIYGGNLEFIKENGIDFEINSQNSIFIFAIEDEVVAYFELKDKPKDGAKELLNYLNNNGYQTIMTTGDNKTVAQNIANEIGIKEVKSNLLPQDKANIVNQFQEKGHKVVMIGDGINDTIALSSSDIAIAMGNGADISIAVSDVVILNNSLNSLQKAFEISKRTFGNIKQNLVLSLIYNTITIPIAMLGYVIPFIAAISMSISSLLVVGNSIRIRNKG